MEDKNRMGAVLALIYTIGFMACVGVLMFVQLPVANEKYFLIGFGSLSSLAALAVQHFLGSSVGSAKKDEMLLRATPPEAAPGAPAAPGS
jgi:hypothetical protein